MTFLKKVNYLLRKYNVSFANTTFPRKLSIYFENMIYVRKYERFGES